MNLGAEVLAGQEIEPPVSSAAEIQPLPVTVEAVPEGLAGVPRRLWIVRREIDAVRLQLAHARARGAANTASLGDQLRKLLADEAELEPAPPPDANEEEASWKAVADSVVAKIEAGVRAFEARAS